MNNLCKTCDFTLDFWTNQRGQYIMLSVDNFEEQLREEYGKIFDNISYFRARRRKHRFHERGNAERGKDLCLATSYEDMFALQDRDESMQTTDKTTAEQGKCRSIKTLHCQKEHQNEVNAPENESKNCSLYEKVAMDLETVFNKYMMINQDPGSEKSFEGEKNAEDSLNVQNITEREKAMLRNEMTYKTVRTKNDTLYIWTAHV